jgi:GTP-binding protein HflX
MYETTKVEKALLVVITVEKERDSWTQEEIAQEFKNLVISTGIEVQKLLFVKRKEPTPALYIGKGKAFELAEIAQKEEVDVVIFNNNLNFTQQRNLEEIIGVKTIDRTQLILDIFARHAHTQEGALQVELAQLEYLLPRLKGKGIMLSRLGGGIGTRGPGEKKLEVDRRRITDKIIRLKKELEQVRKHREVIRKKRQKEKIKVCSLVGYTNAGKTTLLNALTGDIQRTSSSLFTTLDPVGRTLTLSNHYKVIITDTVGFLYKLPPNLVEAFHATLEELTFADLILHIVDSSSKNYSKMIEAVNLILRDLSLLEKPTLVVFNKIDELDEEGLRCLQNQYPEGVFISALKKTNLDTLLQRIQETLFRDTLRVVIRIPFREMKVLDWLYTHAQVIKVDYKENEAVVLAHLQRALIPYLEREELIFEEI